MLMMPINRITRQMQSLQQASASISRIRKLFDVETKIYEDDVTAQEHLGDGPLAVEFAGVSFGYDDDLEKKVDKGEGKKGEEKKDEGKEVDKKEGEKELVLHGLSFHLQPGAVLGLLGRTGSGKTTLTRLIFRLWDPDEGAVCLGTNGSPTDIRHLPLTELRQHVGMVTQNIQLFHATVRDNLTFFDPDIPDERILQVIDDLGLGTWFRSLPEGLDTELESGGSGLSAGEQQLLAFTRIFLRNPGLVILDEASSRLDPATEHLIERAVDRLVQNRTAIIIAHRLGTVQRADEIMILEDGHIREHGARAALAADPQSRFYSLLQTGMEEVLV